MIKKQVHEIYVQDDKSFVYELKKTLLSLIFANFNPYVTRNHREIYHY